MAAMAPALTDATAEAHRIRFKLAPPTSDLSLPASSENNSNATNILLCNPNGAGSGTENLVSKPRRVTNGTGHHRYRSVPQGKNLLRESDSLPLPVVSKNPSLGKLQPLVASYLCSDVSPLSASTQAKDSLKSLQGALIQHQAVGLFAATAGSGEALLRKRQALEITGGQLQGLLGTGDRMPSPKHTCDSTDIERGNCVGDDKHATPINGHSRKAATNGTSVVNGGGEGKSTSRLSKAPPLTRRGVASLRAAAREQQRQQQEKESVQVSTPAEGVCDPPHTTLTLQQHPAPSLSHGNGSSLPPLPPNSPSTSPQHLEVMSKNAPSCSPSTQETPDPSTTAAVAPQSGPSTLPPSPFVPPRLPSPASVALQMQERTQQTERRQADIENRVRRLRKRLQVVQAKQVERHTQQQLNGLLDKTGALRGNTGGHGSATAGVGIDFWGRITEPSPSSLASSAGLANFLRSGAVPAELERLHLSSGSFLRSAEAAFDSDATESSSGGESDVEQDEIPRVDLHRRHVTLWRRAEGRYALDRAAIISHWNWLQAHVSDLEYRIRQQADIYRQIRVGKGLVELGGPAPSEASQGTDDLPSTSSERDAEKHLTTEIASSNPGDVPKSEEKCFDGKMLETTTDPCCVAARTRPLLNCRRRRLVNPNTLSSLTAKKTWVVGCGTNSSCLMCGSGRRTQTTPPNLELPTLERLAHLDHGFHAIISLPSDMRLATHLQRMLKSQEADGRSKPRLKKHSLKHKLALRLPHTHAHAASKRKHKLINSHMAAIRLAHHRRNHLERPHYRSSSTRNPDPYVSSSSTAVGSSLCRAGRAYERSNSRKRRREHSEEKGEGLEEASPTSSVSSSLALSTPSPLSRHLALPSTDTASTSALPQGFIGQSGAAPIRRRRGESSFDINNIVIPMSVAATTRVEKLQYKEILTPRWRKVNVLEEPLAEDEDHVEVEDLSDSVFVQLHTGLEVQEKEKTRWAWRSLPPAKRRASRFFKSLDGRSTPLLGGTNPSTPQPSSPDTAHFHVLQDYAPLASPLSPSSPHTPSSHDSHTRCSTPDFTYEERTVCPWDHRSFPLAEDPVMLEEPSQHSRNTLGSQSSYCRADSETELVSPWQ